MPELDGGELKSQSRNIRLLEQRLTAGADPLIAGTRVCQVCDVIS
jgi:hypothetical protein